MTLTSFFAMFFMGNTSLYNQLVVRDMVSSNSLNSLLSTLVYILAFTLVIEGIGMLAIWGDIHGTMGMDLQEELAFSAFHAISAFCNAGFSTLPGNLGNPLVMTGHNPFFIYISLLIILGGIGFPILVNFKDIILYHLRRLWHFLRTWHWDGKRFYHLYNLNTKIVLIVTFLLLVLGTVGIAVFEWNASFAGMSVADKWTQAFFNATCPRTAGFTSVDLAGLGVQTLLIYLFLMWVGGGSQSTAGGIKVNAFAVVVLNLVAVLRGTERVEVFGRELSHDSIRRSNATVVMSFGVLLLFIFIISILEPGTSILAITFECVSALSTVGSSLNLTPRLGDDSKLLVALLMFVGRVGLITLMLGIIKQKKHTKYQYPSGQIIIGLGNYGHVLAEELSALGHEVIGADVSVGRVDSLKEKIATAFVIDATDEQALSVLPLNSVDVVIVAIGENFGASIRVVALLKQKKVQHIYARAIDAVHRSVLEAFELERILTPEEDAARGLVQLLEFGADMETFRVAPDYYVVKFTVPDKFIGYYANELNLDKEFGLKMLALKRAETLKNCLGVSYVEHNVLNELPENDQIQAGDQLVCYGRYKDFQKFWKAL